MANVEQDLAEMVVEAQLSDWTPHAQELALLGIGDTFPLGVAGMFEQQTVSAMAVMNTSTGASTAPLWTSAERYAVADAAYIGGVACHALDWDDYMHPMHGHCSAVLLPAAWSTSESADHTGAQLIEAYLVGYQTNYLVSLLLVSPHYECGWHATSTIGTIGAAAAAARAFRLDVTQTRDALALASSFASGLRVNFGTAAKAIHAGAAARNGVQAAQLARAGMHGSADWLTGRYGMLATFSGEPEVETRREAVGAAQVAHGIETAWGLVQKPYSCCGSCHAALDAVIALAKEARESSVGLDEIEVHLDPMVPRIMREPNATTSTSARYCLPWAIAAAAVDLTAGPAQFSEHALDRPEIHQMRERVTIVPDLDTTEAERFAARVVATTGRRVLERAVTHGTGHPSNPMSAAQLAAKQHDALDPVVGIETAARVISTLARLDELGSVSELSDLVRSTAAHGVPAE